MGISGDENYGWTVEQEVTNTVPDPASRRCRPSPAQVIHLVGNRMRSVLW